MPLSQADVKALVAACERTREYGRPGKRVCDNVRPTGLRDKTLLFLLLDTGMRASEVCGITAHDVDLKNRRVTVLGKGDKERSLPISPETSTGAVALHEHNGRTRRRPSRCSSTITGRPMNGWCCWRC